MSTTVDHNYGVSTTPKIPPMLAVPLSGTVKITVTDQLDKLVGETESTREGKWRRSFELEDGIYVIEFKGRFRPIGSGYGSMYQILVNSTKIAIRVPLSPESPPLEPESLPPIDTKGSVGEAGPQGEQGPSGEVGTPGKQGPPGELGPVGPSGPPGETGAIGKEGAKGSTGDIGQMGTSGTTGPRGSTGTSGTAGATGPKGPEILYIENPTAADKKFIAYFDAPKNISEVYGQTDTGSITFNIKYTPKATPNGSGTNIIYPDVAADSIGVFKVPITHIPADSWLFYEASDINGAPTKLWVYLIIS